MHYLLGALPARLGDEMSGQALLLMGFAASGSAALGSTLLACLTISAAVGGPLLGAILDRSGQPGRVLARTIGMYAIGVSLIALSLGHIPTWASMVAALLAGFCLPSISGGWSSRLQSFVTQTHITRASAIDATTFNIAGLFGPAIAGAIAAWAGAEWAIVLLVTLLVAALPMAWALPKRQSNTKTNSTSLAQDVLSGFKVIVARRSLFSITLMSAVSYMGIGMLWVACPLIGNQLLNNPGYGSVLMSVVSIGALIATTLYARWSTKYSPDSVAFVCTLVLAVAMPVLALAGNIFVALAAALLAGFADGPQLAAVFAVRHREAPERSRSQVFTTGASLKITAAAIGAAVAGQLASVSLAAVLMAACAVQLAAMAVYVLLKGLPHRTTLVSSDVN